MTEQARTEVGERLRGAVSKLAVLLGGRDVEAYTVGGFLRDALLGREPQDIDLAVAADPFALGPELADAFGGHYFTLAEEQGIARVLMPDRGVHIDLSRLAGPIEDDLRSRDYTIDAMGARLGEATGGAAEIIDPTGGREDLERRVVRAVSEDNFRADPLRPLRGVRLAVELGFEIEEGTRALIAGYAPQVPGVASERQRLELVRILATDSAWRGFALMDDLGLLEAVLPEVASGRDVEQPKEHHWDVLGHCLEAVRRLDILLGEDEPAGEPWRELWGELWRALEWWADARDYFRADVVSGVPRSAVVKLGGLVHDIAKPETKTFEPSGRMRFFGHPEAGAEKAGRMLKRLHFSAREVALVQTMVRAHMRPIQMAHQGPPSRRAIYRFFRDCGDAAIDTLFLSLADHLATVGPRLDMEGWRQHVALVNYILGKRFQDEAVIAPPRLLRGDELMAELGLSPGPQIGRLLEQIREAQAAGDIATREEAFELARRELTQPTRLTSR